MDMPSSSFHIYSRNKKYLKSCKMLIQKQEKRNSVPLLFCAQKHLRDIYYWPKNGKISYLKGFLVFLIIVLPVLLGVIGGMYKNYKEKEISELMGNLYIFIQMSSSWSYAGIHICYGNELVKLIENLEDNKYGTPRNFEETKKMLEKITNIFHWFLIIVTIIFVLATNSLESNCFDTKYTANMIGYVCGAEIWYPKAVGHFLTSHVMRILFITASFYLGTKLATGFIMYYGCLILTVDRIDHLSNSLEMLGINSKNISLVKNDLLLCIRRYTEVTRLVKDINSTIGVVLSPSQNLYMGLVIALLEYQFIMESQWKYLLPLITWMALEFLFCWIGQLLENSSTNLQKQVYNMPWYDFDSRMKTDFRIFHAQVQKTLQIESTPAVTLNFIQFHRVMKGSYSFMMYVRGMCVKK